MTDAVIYSIRCLVNGRVYVGSTVDWSKRERKHRWHLKQGKHHSRHLQRAWDKHGPDAFEWCILERVPIDGLTKSEAKRIVIAREQHHIDILDSVQKGFNLCPKADSPLGVKRSEEDRVKNSVSHRGIKRSDETRARMSEYQRNRTKEHIATMYDAIRSSHKIRKEARRLARNKGQGTLFDV